MFCARCRRGVSILSPTISWCSNEERFYCSRCTALLTTCPECGRRLSSPYVHGVYAGYGIALLFIATLAAFGPFNPRLYGWHGQFNPFSVGIQMLVWVVIGTVIGTLCLRFRLRLLSLHVAQTGSVSAGPVFTNSLEVAEDIDWVPNSYPRRFRRILRIALTALPLSVAAYALLVWSVWNSPLFLANLVEAYGLMLPTIPAIVAVVCLFGESHTALRVGFGKSGIHLEHATRPVATSASYVAWANVKMVGVTSGSRGVILDTPERPIRISNIDKSIIDRIFRERIRWLVSSPVGQSPVPTSPPR